MKNYKYSLALLLICVWSCKKIVEVGTPQNQQTTDKVFSDTTSATAAMVNVYALFDKTIDANFNKYMGLYTDELINSTTGADITQFNQSNLSSTNAIVSSIWSTNFFAIYSANQIIEQLSQSPKIQVSTAATLTAEAKFLRAYSNLYLVNSFGPLPLTLTTNVDETSKAARSDTSTIYAQIVKDLRDAQTSLPKSYIGTGKVRANNYAATALLSKVYLYQQDWKDAEQQASLIINSGVYKLNSPSTVFLANSDETILAFGTQNGYIADGPSLIPSSGAPNYQISASLISSFETGDLRKANWIKSVSVTSGGKTTTYNYTYKYHNRVANSGTPEFLIALRLAEQYLIRAEARAHQGNITGAVEDINVIRKRAGLPDLSSSINQTTCFNAVAQEWRVEFFMEWGHRFLELKRTGRLSSLLSSYKLTWQSKGVLLPIPQKEITYDPFLNQNSGY